MVKQVEHAYISRAYKLLPSLHPYPATRLPSAVNYIAGPRAGQRIDSVDEERREGRVWI